MKILSWNIGTGSGYTWGHDEIIRSVNDQKPEVIFFQEVPPKPKRIGKSSADDRWLDNTFKRDYFVFSSSRLSPNPTRTHAEYLLMTLISRKLINTGFVYECRIENFDRFALICMSPYYAFINIHLKADEFRGGVKNKSHQKSRKLQILNLCQFDFSERTVIIGGDFNCEHVDANALLPSNVGHLTAINVIPTNGFSYARGAGDPHKTLDYVATNRPGEWTSTVRMCEPHRNWRNGIHRPIIADITIA